MARDPEQFAHQEWLGYVQPVGLVVSIPAMLHAQAHVSRNIAVEHQRFLACLPRDKQDEIIPEIHDFPEFTRSVFGWEADDLVGIPGGEPVPASLEATLPGYNETLRPTYAVREFQPQDASRPWILLVKSLPVGADIDALFSDGSSHWQATPHAKFERLLRETQVPFGLLVNGTHIRLVYAPRGETSGYATFSVADMAKVAGRPIFAALHMLLNVERLFSLPEKQRLPAILADSRKYQNVVSTKLAEQVLEALYELVRGFQAADEQRRGELLRDVLAADPNHVYAGLLTVLLRLVFVLYAEDRGLLSSDPVYSNFYSVTGLFERLRSDAGRYPDTMDQRYGAWAQLLTLFRLVYDGGQHGGLQIPARRGYLFDPDRYNFLEGRPGQTSRQEGDKVDVPRVADGVIYRVLEKLLILDGERLSYRTLDVEQIGSVYETMMGFNLEVAQGRSVAIKPTKSHGAPTAINLDELLAAKPAERVKWIAEKTDQKLAGQAAEALKAATSVEALLAGLDKKIAHHATPNVVPRGAMVLQPSDERRRSGSHYTPRSLTEPIVRTTLKPILEQLGEQPRPEQILALNVCDPAMGSGAFLVEACRQLGDALVEAWHVHDCLPPLPPDEDEVLHARRLVAQQCLYGVDRNPMAVDLAKLSLWLATLAKDHPFTFLDHTFRCGDSLVGLTREQIAGFHWQPGKQKEFETAIIETRIQRAAEFRQMILESRDDVPYAHLQQQLALADESLGFVRLVGDLVVSAFFAADKDKERNNRCDELFVQFSTWLANHLRADERTSLAEAVSELRGGNRPLEPFHWHIEFPEVFSVDARGKVLGGFDAILGNPPFVGGSKISTANGKAYLDWLLMINEGSHGNGDLVAHFFRRAFALLRGGGCFGLIATNTIGQGDTRSSGLRWICSHSGNIYAARKRLKWPGEAAVVVSVVNVCRGQIAGPFELDGREAAIITAYLFHTGGHEDPIPLIANEGKCFTGTKITGSGFTFDDQQSEGVATPTSTMNELIRTNPRNSERVFPYIGGQEVNDGPTHLHSRFVINFEELSESEAREWPDLMAILERTVKATRHGRRNNADGAHLASRWWLFERARTELYAAIRPFRRVIVCSLHQPNWCVTFVPCGAVFSHALGIFALPHDDAFCVLQSRIHETWARFLASSMKDDIRYTPSDCFVTFPFPRGVLEHATLNPQLPIPLTQGHLESPGREYFKFRADLMVRNNEGLTKTYNRFHDPNESSPAILKLRELHAAMDASVLEAYGWHDLAQTATCQFLLDYEEEEEDEENLGSGRSGAASRKKKKPWRYRWTDDFRDEVLARLLELNKQRAEEDRLRGDVVRGKQKVRRQNKSVPKRSTGNELLPGME